MKKILTFLLGAVMLLSMTGCRPTQPAQDTQSASPEAPVQTGIPETPNTASESGEIFAPSATIEETVLVDESDIKITATGLKYTAYDVKLGLAIENNTDQDLSFHSGTLGYSCNAVNGYMVDDGYLSADVSAGKKANETVSFNINELTLLGLVDIADIELGFSITDKQYKDYLQTGPRQVKTSIADSYDYSADTYRRAITDRGLADLQGFSLEGDSKEVLFDQKGVRVLSQVLIRNSSGSQALLVEVENTTSDVIYTTVGDVSLNGLGVQSGAWSTHWVSPGKRRVITINLSNILNESYREVLGIKDFGTVTYTFELKDSDHDALVVPQMLTMARPGGSVSYDASGDELYQEDGIRVVFKGLVPDSFELSDDIHILLLVENGVSETLSFDVDYDSVSVNGYMTDFLCYSRRAEAGGSVVLDVELTDSSLEENGITGLEDITEVELTLEIKNDGYKTVAQPVVVIHS